MSKFRFEESTPYFKATLSPVDPDYPTGLPGAATIFNKINDSSGFIQKKWFDTKKRYSVQTNEYIENCMAFVSHFNKVVSAFDPILTDYDRQEVLPSTCGLGMIKPTHTDFDARGNYDEGSDYEYPSDLIAAVASYYGKYAKREKAKKVTLPRGKNSGWPYPISGRQRNLADILLSLNVAVGFAGRKAGWRLSDTTSFLENTHGNAFLIPGERYQHTTRTMPVITTDSLLFSHNLEPRVRTILMSGKYAVAWNKPFVNAVLQDLMKTPVHVQTRPEISKRISDAETKKWFLYAVDAKRFDGRHGGRRGNQIMKLICDVFGSADNLKDLIHEYSLPVLAFDNRGAYLSKNTGRALMLPSGVSSTTIVNCVGNLVISVGVYARVKGISYAEAVAGLHSKWDFLAWGDDGLLMSPDAIDEKDLTRAYEFFKFSAEFEPTVKFLGSNYAKGFFTGSMDVGYSMGRAVQQQFFPERVKPFPFSTIGYIARLELMGPKAKEFHSIMLRMWPETLGVPFRYEDREATLRALLPEVEKHADKISAIDDVLNVLTHGIDSPDGLSPDLAMFEDFLGISSIDISDPVKILTDAKIDEQFVKKIKMLTSGDLSQYPGIMSDLSRVFNLRLQRSQPLY
jgi:hypothetical protein